MEEKESLIIYSEELKSILARHYFWIDFQTNEDCYHTTSLEIKFNNEEIDHEKIQFILKYDKKIDSFEQPIKKQYIITKLEVINIINKNLLSNGYKIDDFDCNITYGLNKNDKNNLNFISLNLMKKGQRKIKKKGLKKHV